MKHLLRSLFIVLIGTGSLYGENYYSFIGLKNIKKSDDLVAGQTFSSEKEKNQKIAELIEAACSEARQLLEEEAEVAQEVFNETQGYERNRKYRESIKAQRRRDFLKIVCPVLADPTQRKEYDSNPREVPSFELHDEQMFAATQANIDLAMQQLPTKKILINQVLGDFLSSIGDIPGPAAKILNKDVEIRSVNFLPLPQGPDVKYGLGFSGLISINNVEMRLSVYLIQNIYGVLKASFSIEPPESYKVSALFPSLSYLDSFKFPKTKFIIANFEGSDKDGFTFQPGFNFGSIIDLEGPLKILSDLKDKSSYLKSLVFESKPIELHGIIPTVPYRAEFTTIVPMRMGVDLRKISIIPKALSDVINRITTDDFTLNIGPVIPYRVAGKEQRVLSGPTPAAKAGISEESLLRKLSDPFAKINLAYRIKARTGARIELGTQSQPIKLGMTGEIIPISREYPQGMLSVSAVMDNKLDLKWLAFGNAALSIDIDNALIAAAVAAGIPFTGIGIRGQIDLGKEGDARVYMDAAGGFRVKSGSKSGVPLLDNVDLVFKLSADNIRLAHLANYAISLATKARIIKKTIPFEAIPTMTLHKVGGYCSFGNITIADKHYSPGISLQADFQFFDRKAGFSIFMDDQFRLSGSLYLPHLNWSVKGVELFRLSGLSPDKGPRGSFGFDPAMPQRSRCLVQANLAIPALALEQKVDFYWAGSVLTADFETQFDNFSVLFGARMNTKEGTRIVSALQEHKEKLAKLYDAADKSNPDVIAAKKMLDDVDEFVQLKEYNRAQELLGKIEGLLTQYPEETAVAERLLGAEIEEGSREDLLSEVTVLNQETSLLAKAMEQKGLQLPARVKKMIDGANELFKKDKSQKSLLAEIKLLNSAKNYMRQQLGENVAAEEKALRDKEKQEKLAQQSPLFTPIEGFKQRLQEGAVENRPFLLREKEKAGDTSKKWEKLYIKFGFKGDFAAFLNKYAVQNLEKMRDNALKKLDALNQKAAELASRSVEATEQEIERTKASIAQHQQKVDAMQKACSSLPLYKQAGCRAEIVANQIHIKGKQGYLNLLLRPGKHVVKGVAGGAAALTKAITQNNAVRAATEGVLAAVTAGIDMLARGLALINVKEARGEYSWDDMMTGKFPRLEILVARIDLPEDIMPPMEIVLQDLQFDFKNPIESANVIIQRIMTSLVQAQQNKYVRYAMGALEY